MRNKLFGFVYAMNYIAQAAWSFVFPAGLIIGLSWLICERLGAGRWVLVVGIIFGVLSGIYSMFRYAIRMANYATGDFNNKDKKKK